MRTPDNAQVPGEGSTRSVGEGFGGVDPDEIEAYGQDFYEEYDDSYDDSSDSSVDDSDDSTTIDEDAIPADGEMTEEEAEAVLEDALEEEYGSQADEVVEDLEEDTGMSAVEILEDITGLDLDGSEDSSYASSDYDRQMVEAAELEGSGETVTSDLFNEDMPAESDFDVNTDGHVDRHDLDDAAEDLGFHIGH